jgi:hypothetical protein
MVISLLMQSEEKEFFCRPSYSTENEAATRRVHSTPTAWPLGRSVTLTDFCLKVHLKMCYFSVHTVTVYKDLLYRIKNRTLSHVKLFSYRLHVFPHSEQTFVNFCNRLQTISHNL